jgi:hypothetical protein
MHKRNDNSRGTEVHSNEKLIEIDQSLPFEEENKTSTKGTKPLKL